MAGRNAPQIHAFLAQVSPAIEDVSARELLVELVILDLWYRWRLAAGLAPEGAACLRSFLPSRLQATTAL